MVNTRFDMKTMLSYILPISIESTTGTLSPELEVSLYRGRYLLNGKLVNYSYGGLHTIFEQLFRELRIERYEFNKVLLLGMGAGSIVSLLLREYKLPCSITGIEGDDVVIALARKYFGIAGYKDLLIRQSDAMDFVENCNDKFDLIISDLFVEEEVPEKFSSRYYLKQLKRLSMDHACVIFNKMTEKPIHKKEFETLSKSFREEFPGAKTYTLYAGNSQNSLLCENSMLLKGTRSRSSPR